MKSTPVRLLLILLLSLILASGHMLPASAQGAVVRVVPPSIEVGQGQFVVIGIAVENVADLYNVDIRLLFDPNILEVVDDDSDRSGVQITPGQVPYPEDVWVNVADNYAGTIQYSVSQISPRQPFAGSATLCSVRFYAKALGTSPIEIMTTDEYGEVIAVLGTEEAEMIDATAEQGEVVVTEESDPPIIPPSPPTLGPTAFATALQAGSTPSATPTNQSAYPIGTSTTAPPAHTPAPPPGYPAPTAASSQPSPSASPTPTQAATISPEGSPETPPESPPLPTATFSGSMQAAYPELTGTPPAADPAGAEATATPPTETDMGNPAAANSATPIAGPALATTEEPAAAPTAANEPPPVDSAPAEPAPPPSTPQPTPLIPRGLFFVLVAGLVLCTGALFVYLWRGRKSAGE